MSGLIGNFRPLSFFGLRHKLRLHTPIVVASAIELFPATGMRLDVGRLYAHSGLVLSVLASGSRRQAGGGETRKTTSSGTVVLRQGAKSCQPAKQDKERVLPCLHKSCALERHRTTFYAEKDKNGLDCMQAATSVFITTTINKIASDFCMAYQHDSRCFSGDLLSIKSEYRLWHALCYYFMLR